MLFWITFQLHSCLLQYSFLFIFHLLLFPKLLKHKIKCNKISIPIKSNLGKKKKFFFLSVIWILMNWSFPGPSLWCLQKHQNIRLVNNIISVAWRCLILQYIQKLQHRIPQWTFAWFYSFFLILFLNLFCISHSAPLVSLPPCLMHSLIHQNSFPVLTYSPFPKGILWTPFSLPMT